MLKCKPFTIRVDCCVILLIMLGFIDAQFLIELIKVPNIGETEWDVVTTCSASDATFGGSVTDFIDSHENLGSVSPVVPADACSPISVEKWKSKGNDFAAVSRSPPEHPCKFSEQAFNVQNSTYNFKLIIFYNYPGEDPITMNGAKYKNLINLPIVMISHSCMNIISSHNPEKYKVRVRAASTASEILRYLIPIIVVLAFCLVLFLITVCIRTCIERRRLNRRRLSKRNLKKIPVKKYREGDEPDSCAICIENFVPGEKLRHLPCRHIFHCSCVDVWLTKSRKVCPLCKRKIGSDSDSDGSIDENIRSAPTSSTTLNNGETTSASSGQSSSRARTPVTWSSQEALVEREVVFETNQGLGVSGYMRRALQFFRRNRNNHSDDAEPGYHVPDDGDHLLEEEAFRKYPAWFSY